jgi:hypothetical protein
MGLYYHHLLIPRRSGASATVEGVGRFFRALEARGAREGRPTVRLIDLSASQKLKNPFTGEEAVVPKAKLIKVSTIGAALKKAKPLQRYKVSFGVDIGPGTEWFRVERTAPLGAPERIGATVCVFPIAVPTSDADFGKPGEAIADHRFSHPQTGEEFLVEGAGSARFWIDVEFEKFEIPLQDGTASLDIAPAWYVSSAEEAFETTFVQGAQWH